MRSSRAGTTTSRVKAPDVEVLNVGRHGIWLEVQGGEYLLSFTEHPYFADATIRELLDVELLHNVHLRWPELDVDLHVDSLKHPERFPLRAQHGRALDTKKRANRR